MKERENIPEDRIIWRPGGLSERVRKLETRSMVSSGTGPGGASGVAPGVPAKPTDLTIISQELVTDASGTAYVEVVLTWESAALGYEIAIARE